MIVSVPSLSQVTLVRELPKFQLQVKSIASLQNAFKDICPELPRERSLRPVKCKQGLTARQKTECDVFLSELGF